MAPQDRMLFTPISVGSLGSTDPKYQTWAKDTGYTGGPIDTSKIQFKSDATPDTAQQVSQPPLNPLLQDFSSLLQNKDFKFELQNNPQLQAQLFDLDNIIKAQSGIFRAPADGVLSFGTDLDGSKLYQDPQMLEQRDNFGLGATSLNNIGTLIDSLGGFRDPYEAMAFTGLTQLAGSPEFQGELSAQLASGDKTGAINTLLQRTGNVTLDKVDTSDKKSLNAAFGAFNVVSNWDNMNAGQRSQALAGMAMTTYKYATGESLGDRILIGEKDGPNLSVGTALGLASTGVDVSNLMRNWDQLSTLGKLTYGANTAAEIATIAKQMGFLGDPNKLGKAIETSAEALGAAGFTGAPSMGVGAVVGPATKVPPGYRVIGKGTEDGTVVAVPEGLESTATGISLNNVNGVALAGLGVYNVYENWGRGGVEGGLNGAIGGTQVAQGVANLGMTNPYMLSGIIAMSAMGGVLKGDAAKAAGVAAGIGVAGTAAYQASSGAVQAGAEAASQGAAQSGSSVAGDLGSYAAVAMALYQGYQIYTDKNMTPEEKGKATRETAGKAVGAATSFGISALAEAADTWWNDGRITKEISKFNDKLPGSKQFDSLVGSLIGGKSKERLQRDHMRRGFQKAGVINDKWEVLLADGSTFNVGLDKSDGLHEVRDKSRIVKDGEDRSLFAYDVDYTNDLDFSANMMTTALARMLSGGKSTPIDQMAGQLANASLGNVGYGQDMTEDNFNKARDNVRVWFAQSGIQSKEDAYALANQAFAEERMSEMDLAQMHQGINMVFDDNGYDSAISLMEGRWRGIELAAQPNAYQGPTLSMVPRLPAAVGDSITTLPGTSQAPEGLTAAQVAQQIAANSTKIDLEPSAIPTPGIDGSLDPNSLNAWLTKYGYSTNDISFASNLKQGSYGNLKTSGLYRTAMDAYKNPYRNE